MVSLALRETGHTLLNSNHLVAYTTPSESSRVGLQRRPATRRRPNYDFTSAELQSPSPPALCKEGRTTAGEILTACAAFLHLWNSSAQLGSRGDKMTSSICLVKSSIIWLTGRWKINNLIKTHNLAHYKHEGQNDDAIRALAYFFMNLWQTLTFEPLWVNIKKIYTDLLFMWWSCRSSSELTDSHIQLWSVLLWQ